MFSPITLDSESNSSIPDTSTGTSTCSTDQCTIDSVSSLNQESSPATNIPFVSSYQWRGFVLVGDNLDRNV